MLLKTTYSRKLPCALLLYK